MRRTIHVLTTLLLALALSACLAQEPSLYTIQNDLHGPYQVDRVTDGDTIRVHTAEGSVPVRLIAERDGTQAALDFIAWYEIFEPRVASFDGSTPGQ